jgi:hypothetical protein
MIQLPRRSVTRFFIPLIDVLTLLFCIFLLMPVIKATGEGAEPQTLTASQDGLQAPGSPLRTGEALAPERGEAGNADSVLLRRERGELEKLQKEKIETLQQRLFIRVLEIDADTGKLFYHEGDQRIEVAGPNDALELVRRHKREAGARELYYLFLFPRRLTGFPEERQVKQYEEWFKGTAHGRDNPLTPQ